MITYPHELGEVRVMEPGDDLTPALGLLAGRAPLSVDTETTGLGVYLPDFRVRLVQLGTPELAYVLPLEEHPGARAFVREWFGKLDRRVWLHNRTYDLLALERDCGVDFHDGAAKSMDTGILSRLLDPRGKDKGGTGHGLKDLSVALLKADVKDARAEVVRAGRAYKVKAADIWCDIPTWDETYLRYAGQDVLLTSRLAAVLTGRVAEQGLGGLAAFEHLLDYRLAHITRRGMRLDVPYTESVRDRYLGELAGLEAELEAYGVTPTASGYRHSAKASLVARFQEYGVRWRAEWYTDPSTRYPEGQAKLDDDVLQYLATHGGDVGKLASIVLQAKRAKHYGEGYAGGFLDALGHDGRVHPVVNPLAAATGRMSISDPPLQQIPSDDVEVRGCFTADEGETLLGADFSQVEYRVAAGVCGDEAMREAILNGEDLHANVARTLVGEGWTKQDRQVAKTAGLGRLYGSGVATIARQTGVTEAQAKRAVAAFDTTYPGVRRFAQKMGARIENGQHRFKTVTGRPLIVDRPWAGINYQVQSPARDIMAQGVLNLFDAGLGDALRLVIHDEVVVSVPEADVEEAGRAVEKCLNRTFLGVPITAEAEDLGERWRKA